ncbi:probable LRR receptor-like serine/threonine-protein kinase at1g53440 [Phtheirospermum japonicum]|uniref:non-specific serine/threonine protein kinase n=1 Tax=Phtheirospermum japonicum TaxID=374723 RepID=A0A830DAS9_9LAMI|nr:probable LRR receptor-like serine/threonine-protein kinase at1g53440 [Phtheirospermum japonicum]
MEFFLDRRASSRANLVKRLFIASVCAVFVFTSAAQLLPVDEVEVLRTISSTLQNNHWTISRSSCTDANGFNMTIVPGDIESNVTCDCSFSNNTVCHVTNILLKGLNLTGTLPVEFVNLTYLLISLEITSTEQFLECLACFVLSICPLVGNRLTGRIPDEIGDITTLEGLVLEDNLLEGNLPASLGRLRNLRRLQLSANIFNGTIPETYANLRNLTEFRIDGSNLSGRIPDFIGNWTMLNRLRISDLRGPIMSIPDLRGMTAMLRLILRNCSITGRIPPYIGDMTELRLLFLSHNSLTGAVPDWIMDRRDDSMSRPVGCTFPNVNLVASHSASVSNSDSWCLSRDLPCSGSANHHSLFINCGGGATGYEGNDYEPNLTEQGASFFEPRDNRWAYSNSGAYMGLERDSRYIAANDTPMIDADAEFYQTARLSPSSLKYYGLCMRRGSYRVRLFFAEIMYFDNETYSSLGRRIFDVAIQGQVVLPDFDIAREANGVRRGIMREFNNVVVNGSTLEIHLYWTGKGTTAIPNRGVYGPLISAIAVTPNFDVSAGLSAGAIAGIVVSSLVVVVLLGVLSDGTIVAVKQLSSKSKQGNREFVNEIGMISALQHPNLVKLFGCCREEQRLNLDWSTRKKICIGIAKGLAYLHEESRLKIVHRDIKATNVLLDKDLNAKISDFGLAKLDEEENTHISTRIAGTIGYMAPEYAMRGYLTDKADVYSFGIVLLEIVSGKSNTNYRPKEEFVYLLDWAYVLQEQGNLLDLVDPCLGSDYSKDEALKILNMSLLCTNISPTLRPSMSSVVSMLKGKTKVQAPLVKRGAMDEDVRFKAFEVLSQDSQTRVSLMSQDSREHGPWVDSSVSSKDETRDHSTTSKLLADLL